MATKVQNPSALGQTRRLKPKPVVKLAGPGLADTSKDRGLKRRLSPQLPLPEGYTHASLKGAQGPLADKNPMSLSLGTYA